MTRSALIDHLSEASGLATDDFSDDTALFSGGLLDSFHMVDLISYLEKETGSKIRAGEVSLENFDTPGRIVAFLGSRGVNLES